MDLILASTSTYRRALLERLRVPFRCVAPRVNERDWKNRGLSPVELATRLAEVKATSVSETNPHATVIGCDQLASIGNRILSKPGSIEAACAQLAAIAGQSHELITALAVWDGGQIACHVDRATLWMRSLSANEIARYVEIDQPVDCAGAYKFECNGRALFERVDCVDPDAITGLPLRALAEILRTLHHDMPLPRSGALEC